MDAAPRRSLLNGRSVAVTIFVFFFIGLFLLWKNADLISPPFKPPDINSKQHRAERLGGLASVSDTYITLLAKADAYNKPDLLKYLQSLDQLTPGERLSVGQALDHGPIEVSLGAAGFAEISCAWRSETRQPELGQHTGAKCAARQRRKRHGLNHACGAGLLGAT